MSGKFNPVTFSEDLFENKLRNYAKIEDEQGFTYDLPKDFLFPKGDLKRVMKLYNKNLNKFLKNHKLHHYQYTNA
jgi:hypothetical protein